MAAATINSQKFTVFGDKQVVLANLSIADTNTYAVPGLSSVDSVQITCNDSTAAYGSYTQATSSGVVTLTFKVSATKNYDLVILGN